jgi:hypothetical protein
VPEVGEAYVPEIIFATVALGRERSSSAEPPPESPSRSDMLVVGLKARECIICPASGTRKTVQSPHAFFLTIMSTVSLTLCCTRLVILTLGKSG